MFLLRNYKPSDFEELYAIDQECFDPGIAYSPVELQFYMKRKGAFTIVAEAKDDHAAKKGIKGIVGFTTVEVHPTGFGHVITIDIRKGMRCSGLGTMLMKAGEERVMAEGGRLMVLEVAVNNMAAIKFYKRHDYSVVKTIPRYYNGELDALFMTKRLVAPQTASKSVPKAAKN